MAERNITSVDLLESVTNKTNAIVEENGTLNKVNLHNEFNTVNTKIDNEVNTLSNNIAQLSNPNLLINSDWRTCGMTCVNQRGQSNYIGHWENTVYTIDRWKIAGGSNQMSMKINSHSITLTSNTTTYQWFGQQLEHALTPGTYTFTISVKSMTCATYLTLNDKFYDLHEGKNVITDEFGSGVDGFWIITHAVGTIELEYIKLEAGSVSTPLIPRSYGEELAICQRYYRKLSSWASSYPLRGDNNSVFIFLTGVMMRTNPTISALNAGSVPTLSYGGTASGMNPSSNNISSTVIGAHQRWDGVEIEFKRETEVVNNGSGVLTIACHLDAEIY